MSKSVAIVQSNYVPWKGYFDMIARVDEFILFDDMQYTRRDWRNRNQIKTPKGREWITIPVEVKGKYFQKINETRVCDEDWRRSHWATISANYRKAPHFAAFADRFETLYLGMDEPLLSRINYAFIHTVCEILGIETRISWSTDYPAVDGKTERLVGLCRAAEANHYLSGPAARDYIQPERFEKAGIGLEYMDYDGYPEYPQLWGEFSHGVTVLDLLFNCGKEAPRYMKHVRR